MALTDKLTAIGVAIRAKTGKSDLLTLDQMPTEIASITTGGGGGNEPTDEELVVTGNCSHKFSEGGWDWFIKKYGDRMTTVDVRNAGHMFLRTNLTEIPFVINIKDCVYLNNMFDTAGNLTTAPKVRGTITWNTNTDFGNFSFGLQKVPDLEDMLTPEMLDGYSTVKITSSYSAPDISGMTQNLCSIRRVPSWFYKLKLNSESTAFPASYSCLYNSLFSYCYSLDEVTNIPVWHCTAAQTSNMFSNFCNYGRRLKNITFETHEDGSPIEVQWKSQTINLRSAGVGFSQSGEPFQHNSGLPAEKWVTNAEKYELYKNDDDWTGSPDYSRYNHDSAVATINSLPDTSAYLATAGGTNTIQFYGDSGKLTDGGAIKTLTEEEIAVAAAKGWTVSFS